MQAFWDNAKGRHSPPPFHETGSLAVESFLSSDARISLFPVFKRPPKLRIEQGPSNEIGVNRRPRLKTSGEIHKPPEDG